MNFLSEPLRITWAARPHPDGALDDPDPVVVAGDALARLRVRDEREVQDDALPQPAHGVGGDVRAPLLRAALAEVALFIVDLARLAERAALAVAGAGLRGAVDDAAAGRHCFAAAFRLCTIRHCHQGPAKTFHCNTGFIVVRFRAILAATW